MRPTHPATIIFYRKIEMKKRNNKIIEMNDFVDIPGYPGYQVTRSGIVRSNGYKKLNKILKPIDSNGYSLVKCGSLVMIHRLVAFTFIPNPDNLVEVDHINNRRSDNRVENLQWISHADNVRKQSRNIDCKGYCWSQYSWRVHYTIDSKQHTKRFKHEDDAQFYVSLLKVIYPRY